MTVQTTGFSLWERDGLWEVRNAQALVVAACCTAVLYALAMLILAKTRFRLWMIAPLISMRRNWFVPWLAKLPSTQSNLRLFHYTIRGWTFIAYAILVGLAVSAALTLYYAASFSEWGNFRQKPLAMVSMFFYLLTILTMVIFWRRNQWSLASQLRVIACIPNSLDPLVGEEQPWAEQTRREAVLRRIFFFLVFLALGFITVTNTFLIPFGECRGEEIAWMYNTCNHTIERLADSGDDFFEDDATWHVGSNWLFLLFNSVFVIATAFLLDLYVHAGVDLVVEVQTHVAQSLMRYGVNAHQSAMMSSTELGSHHDASEPSQDIEMRLKERAPTAQERVNVLMNMNSNNSNESDDLEDQGSSHDPDFDDDDDDNDNDDTRKGRRFHREAKAAKSSTTGNMMKSNEDSPSDSDNHSASRVSNFDTSESKTGYVKSSSKLRNATSSASSHSSSSSSCQGAASGGAHHVSDWDALPDIESPIREPLSSPDGKELLDREMARAYEVLKTCVWKQMVDLPGLRRPTSGSLPVRRTRSSRHTAADNHIRAPAWVVKPAKKLNYLETLLQSYMGILRSGIMITYAASLTVLLMHAILHLILTQRSVTFFQAVGIIMADSILLLKYFENTNIKSRHKSSHNISNISRAQPWHVAFVLLAARIVLISVPSDSWFIGQACLYTIAGVYLSRGLAQEYISKRPSGKLGRHQVLRAFHRVRGPSSLFRACWLTGVVFMREILFVIFFLYFGGLTLLLSFPSVDNTMRLGINENSSGYVTVMILDEEVPQYKIGMLALLIVCNFFVGFLAWQFWFRIRGKRPLHLLSNFRLMSQVLVSFAGVMLVAIYSAHFISYQMFDRPAKFSVVGTVATMLPTFFIGAYVHQVWVKDDFRFLRALPKRVILPADPSPNDDHYDKLRNYAAKVKAARTLIWRRNVVVIIGCLFVVLGFTAWGISLGYEIEDLDPEFAILFPCATFALLCGVLGAQLWFNTLQISRGLMILFLLLVASMLVAYIVGLEEVITSKGTSYNDFLDIVGFFLLLVPVFISGVGAMQIFRDDHFQLTGFVIAAGLTCCAILLGLGAWFIIRFTDIAGIFYYLSLMLIFILSGIWLWWHSTKLDSDKRFRPTRRLLWIVVLLICALLAVGLWDLCTEKSDIVGDAADPLYGLSYFILAYALALIFSVIYILSIHRDLVRKSTRLCPSPSLFGIPAIAFKVENRGGELYKHNSPLLWVIGVLFSIQLLGLLISWTVQPNAGVSITCVAICLMEIYAMHMTIARSIQFRGNLLEIDDVSELDAVFERILRESVERCLQISQQAMMASWLRTCRPHLDESGEREDIPLPSGYKHSHDSARGHSLRRANKSDLVPEHSASSSPGLVLREFSSAPELPSLLTLDFKSIKPQTADNNQGRTCDENQYPDLESGAALRPFPERSVSTDEIVINSVPALIAYYKELYEQDLEHVRYMHDGCKYDALFNVLFWMRTTQTLLEQRAAIKRSMWSPLASDAGDSVSAASSGQSESIHQIMRTNSSDSTNGILDDARKVIPQFSSTSLTSGQAEQLQLRIPPLPQFPPFTDATTPGSPKSKTLPDRSDSQRSGSMLQTPTSKALKFLQGARGSLRAASKRFSSDRNPAEDRNVGRLSIAQSVSQRKDLIASQYERRGSNENLTKQGSGSGTGSIVQLVRHGSGLNNVKHSWKHLNDEKLLAKLASILRRDGVWQDNDFPATNASLFLDWDDEDYLEYMDDLDDEDIRGAVWCRPHEFFPPNVAMSLGRQVCVKPADDDYDPTEVLQGGTGDCWLLSAISVVALFPKLLDHVVVTKRVTDKGLYHVRLFLDGKWENILVDDRFPCSLEQSLEFDPNDETKTLRLSDRPPDVVLHRGPHREYDSNEVRRLPLPQYCRSRSGNVLWPMLIEKAYAKRFGSYEALNGGHVHSALVDLTGGLSQVFSLHDDVEVVMSGALWDKLLEFYHRGALLAAGSPAPQMDNGSDRYADGQLATDRNGIVHGHAYSIVRVVDESDYNGHHRLLQLRDPWGISRWNGPWSRKDRQRWTRRMQRRLSYEVDSASRVDGLREILSQMDEDDNESQDPLGSVPTGFESDSGSRPQGSRDDGEFWISLEEFVARFQWLYVCQIFENDKWLHRTISAEWKGITAGGPPNQPGARYNPQYSFRLKAARPHKSKMSPRALCMGMKQEMVTVFFSISNLQESHTSRHDKSRQGSAGSFFNEPEGVDPFGQYEHAARESGRMYPFMSLLLLDIGGKRLEGELLAKSVVASTGKYKDSRDLSFEIKLPCTADVTYTIFPSLFPRGREGAFRINIYCETDFEVAPLPLDCG
eukprot:CAMPEP_0171484960 /NCGR_PEP_ID=MMETSP0958-20121227/289_1 /TAXON_ID=87120 /ORGANISM="Aurantiochytrium limacinum, Strain ATCCMYA-1381" /LENGTH=2315 /DNA_ID=CAMNT_0012017715 /DNA_START=1111 /DNA_END=8054 /DNA_ORIENTATION=-